MSNKDHNKPGGKPNQRNKKAGRKPDQRQSPKPDQQDANVKMDAAVASTATPPIGAVKVADTRPVEAATAQIENPPTDAAVAPVDRSAAGAAIESAHTRPVDAAIAPIDKPAIDAAVAPVDSSAAGTAIGSAETAAVSLQTIATAYGDYTKKSFEETKCFVEKLSGVRSLDKAVEVQTEFAKQAYETFVAESQKIRQLYGELAKQTLKPLQGLTGKTTRGAR